MRKVLLLCIAIFCVSYGFSQAAFLKYQIYLDVSKGYLLYAIHGYDSSAVTNWSSEESKSIKIFNSDNLGSLNFDISDTNENIFIKGHYLKTKLVKSDLTKIVRHGNRVATSKVQPTTAKYYYRPLRNGKWYYYNRNGELIKTENYINGKLSPL